MGLSIYPVLEKPIAGFDVTGMDGKSLAKALPKEDDGSIFAPILGFISIDPEQFADLLGDEELDDDLPELEEQWFLPQDGLAAIQPMVDALRTQADEWLSYIPAGSEGIGRILDDLEALEHVLNLAQENGVRFHLRFDI